MEKHFEDHPHSHPWESFSEGLILEDQHRFSQSNSLTWKLLGIPLIARIPILEQGWLGSVFDGFYYDTLCGIDPCTSKNYQG